LLVQFGATLGGSLADALARLGVGQTFALGLLQRRLLDQHALALVASARAAEPDHDRIERRVLSGASRERCIPAGQEHEVVEVGAGEAERPLFLHAEEAAFVEFRPTLRTCRLTDDREHAISWGRLPPRSVVVERPGLLLVAMAKA